MFTQKTNKSMSTNYKFIVVYDKFTKPVANSLKNKAKEMSINSTSWSEQEYLHNEAQLNNDNNVLFLSEKLIKENLSNPSLKPNYLINGVFYKKQGANAGIYVDNKEVKCSEIAKRLSNIFKEGWGKCLIAMISGGLIGINVFAFFRYLQTEKKAKLYLLFKATDTFAEKHLKNFVNNSISES